MQHFYDKITGWAAFADLYFSAVKMAPYEGAKFVEVGSWLGRSAALMAVEIANSQKKIEFTCVDPWEDGGPDLRDTEYFKKLKEPVYELFQKNVAPVLDYIKMMKMSSVEASRFMIDESIDFLMLDGDHSYEAVRNDIAAWLPKMKPGSLISGDDFGWPGVEQAVREAFGERAKVVWRTRHRDYRMTSSYWSVRL
jgi:predicted O-methyltransferase YrrM